MQIAKGLRSELLSLAESIPSDDVAVFLSSGVDSMSVLFSLLEVGKTPHAYTFHLEGVESQDLIYAQECARLFNVSFEKVTLPSSVSTLKRDLVFMSRELEVRGKANIECTWPMIYAINQCNYTHIATGSCADGHFVISKKGCIHYRHTVEKMDEYRDSLFNNPNYAQVQTLALFASEQGKVMHVPYFSQGIVDLFKGTSWESINKPKQKQPIISAFPEYFDSVKIFRHTNLQLGDSGIANHFTKLLDTGWNSRGWKSPVGIYNAVAKGEIG